MSTLSFHFHGYQPGDIVRWREPDPLRPQTFEQRHSPVVLRIGPDHVEGRNWTDAVLRTYGRMGSVLHRASGSASVDIEPQTLVWLLERDPSAYRAIIAAYDSGTAGFVMTPPFHPILPHLHRQEPEVLFDLMFDFYSPLIQRAEGRPIGLWLPEAAYSPETMDSFRESARQASVELDAIGDSIQSAYLVADARQFAHPPESGEAWVRVNSTERLLAIARDHPLSGDFAFGATTGSEFVASVRSRGNGSLFVANDLESLLANPMQAERFESIVHSLLDPGHRTRRNRGSPTVRPAAPIGRCDPASPRVASPLGLLWPSLVPRSLPGSGVVKERDRLRRIRRGPRRRQDGRRGRRFPRSRLPADAHGDALRPEVLGQSGHEGHVPECRPPRAGAPGSRGGERSREGPRSCGGARASPPRNVPRILGLACARRVRGAADRPRMGNDRSRLVFVPRV